MEKITNFASLFDYIIKGMIALILATAGFIFKDIHAEVKASKMKLEDNEVRIRVLESNYQSVDKKIDKIDTKIDLLIREVKR